MDGDGFGKTSGLPRLHTDALEILDIQGLAGDFAGKQPVRWAGGFPVLAQQRE